MAQITNPVIEQMVSRFLSWRLPDNFNPDGGISFERVRNAGTVHEFISAPVGTNLLDYNQAKEMVLHMVQGLDLNQPPAMPSREEVARAICDVLHKDGDWGMNTDAIMDERPEEFLRFADAVLDLIKSKQERG